MKLSVVREAFVIPYLNINFNKNLHFYLRKKVMIKKRKSERLSLIFTKKYINRIPCEK
jgi:hypothetical protein